MSHNLYTLNNVGGDVQCYHGTNQGVIYLGRGETAAYSGSLSNGQVFEWYDSNPINTITGASFTAGSAANWYSKFTLPSGTYTFSLNALLPGTGAGAAYLRMYDASATQIRFGQVLCSSSTYLNLGQAATIQNTLQRVLTFSSSETIHWQFDSFSRTLADTGNRISECQYILIRKVA